MNPIHSRCDEADGPIVNVIGGGQFDPFFVVNDVRAIEGQNITIASDGAAGSIITAIPEPSSMVLVSIALLTLGIRRRENLRGVV